jgi:hypothetical protein
MQGTALMPAETIPTVPVHGLRLIKTCALSLLQDRRRVTMARARPDPIPGYTGSIVRLIRVCIFRAESWSGDCLKGLSNARASRGFGFALLCGMHLLGGHKAVVELQGPVGQVRA